MLILHRRMNGEAYNSLTMVPKKANLLSAEIALRSASGKSFDNQTSITSENIADYLPPSEVVEKARGVFAKAGFEVSKPAGLGFSITAPASVFKKVFKVRPVPDSRGGVKVMEAGAAEGGYELPVKNLPKELAQYVAVATFSPPPDFGPTSF
jgi:hypothetical protein